jgi:transcriptional regulator with XRE-family HTH domain
MRMPPTVESERVAASVRAEMARRRVSQQALADVLGHSQAWISRRVSGEVEFTVDELRRVAAALVVPLAQLLGEDKTPEPEPARRAV